MKVDLLEQKFREKLNSLPPQVVVENIEMEKKVGVRAVDFVGDLKLQGGVKKKVIFEITGSAQIASIRQKAIEAKERASLLNAYPAVGGVFFGERARKVCKDEGVGFVDLTGNVYFSVGNVYFEKEVNKNPFSKTPPLRSLFTLTASRIIRAVLVEPKQTWRVRDLVEAGDVSVGYTQRVIKKLINEEFGKRDKGRRFVVTAPGELLDEWSKEYSKNKNKRAVFYSFEKDQDKLLALIEQVSQNEKLTYALGYVSGALKVAPFIRGFNKVQFFARSQNEVEQYQKLLDLSLVESGGNVEIFLPYDEGVFYKLQEIDGIKIVSNIQLYIDLINYPGRGKEQAQHLRERVIKF